jgi:DNA-binding NtrC family response regulator
MLTRSEAVILSTDWEWRHAFAHILDANGLDYAFASNVEDCKEIVDRERVELIFWDSHLDTGSYQDLLQLLRSPADRVKLVVVSHMDDWDRSASGARKGAFAVVPFPGQPTDIEWVLSRASRAASLETRSSQIHELPTHA